MPNEDVYYFATGDEVTDIADAIRAKTTVPDSLVFPDDFVDAIEGLPNVDESDATATAADIASGKTAYVDNRKVTGEMGEVTADSAYGVSTSNRTITGDGFLDHDIVIRGVTTSNLTAANIASGVVVKVGDSENAGAIANITGTHSGGGGTWTSTSVKFPANAMSCSTNGRYQLGTITSTRIQNGIKGLYSSRTSSTPNGIVYFTRTSTTSTLSIYFLALSTGTLAASSITVYYSYL